MLLVLLGVVLDKEKTTDFLVRSLVCFDADSLVCATGPESGAESDGQFRDARWRAATARIQHGWCRTIASSQLDFNLQVGENAAKYITTYAVRNKLALLCFAL